MFEPNSRYFALESATAARADGALVTYKRRRFVPASDGLTSLVEATVAQGERLDVLTARTLGDPEQFWRICDANDALDPAELTGRAGRVLRIPMPQA